MAKHVRADKLDPAKHLVVEDGKSHRVVSVHKSASKPGGVAIGLADSERTRIVPGDQPVQVRNRSTKR
jgi:hypothetical protein